MPPLSIMIKPASSLCNMRCEYCFYHNVTELRQVSSFGIMTNDTADNLIEKSLHFANGESVAFAFQGGEPLMAGLPYFQHFVEKVKSDEKLLDKFKKDPIKTVEGIIGIDLPDDVMDKVVDGVKAKVSVDKLSGALGSLKKLF